MPQRERESETDRKEERERKRANPLVDVSQNAEAGTKGTHLRLPRSALASWLAVGQAGRPQPPVDQPPFRQAQR